MFPLVPIAVGALAITAGVAAHKRFGKKKLSKDQQQVYEAALKTLKDSGKLRTLADAFEKEGFKDEAAMLRKRAKLRELPKEIVQQRKHAFKKAINSTEPEKVLKVAQAFHDEGATGAAGALRKYASDLQSGKAKTVAATAKKAVDTVEKNIAPIPDMVKKVVQNVTPLPSTQEALETVLETAPNLSVSHSTIRQGSTGDDVVAWQKIIGVTADGKFGPMTAAATKAWQTSHGLVADGIVGPKTWGAV